MLFQIIAVVILAVFYGCYFIKMLRQKKRGIDTNQLGKGKTGFVRGVEIATKTASLLVPAAELVSIILNVTFFPTWARICGAAIAALGTGMFITAVVTMRDSWRAGVPTEDKTTLVTTGIFGISRNPAFFGFDLVYLGVAVMFFSWWLFALSIFAMLMFHLQITNVEEDFLLKAFGDEYLRYRRTVNRYFGRRAGKSR